MQVAVASAPTTRGEAAAVARARAQGRGLGRGREEGVAKEVGVGIVTGEGAGAGVGAGAGAVGGEVAIASEAAKGRAAGPTGAAVVEADGAARRDREARAGAGAGVGTAGRDPGAGQETPADGGRAPGLQGRSRVLPTLAHGSSPPQARPIATQQARLASAALAHSSKRGGSSELPLGRDPGWAPWASTWARLRGAFCASKELSS
mmetsp:Transcript_97527/g.278887  ORF Transcript_97527/g.278887 Transcript_97527/m.278887 type:complete len:205 (-) Transcript_97527:64-678(-)